MIDVIRSDPDDGVLIIQTLHRRRITFVCQYRHITCKAIVDSRLCPCVLLTISKSHLRSSLLSKISLASRPLCLLRPIAA